MPKFNKRKDEFSGYFIYVSKNAPTTYYKSYVYLSFEVISEKAWNLKMQIQYCGADWIFYQRIAINADDNIYSIECTDPTRENTADYVTEYWCDPNPPNSLLKDLRHAKTAKIKHFGEIKDYSRELSKKELQAIQETIELYIAMGGRIDL